MRGHHYNFGHGNGRQEREQHIMRTYVLLGSCMHWIIQDNPGMYFKPYITDEKSEAQRSQLTNICKSFDPKLIIMSSGDDIAVLKEKSIIIKV